jgi:sarcosine oxidase, subunit beta
VSEGNSRTDSLVPTADIVILGAGVMGASIAFHLAKRKAGKIVVIDRGHVGQGGSGRSSALIRMHYSYPPSLGPDIAEKYNTFFKEHPWPRKKAF